MRNMFFVLLLCSMAIHADLYAQEPAAEKRVKSVTGYNYENKKKELDHLTNFNKDGLKSDETEYFSDGKVKSRTIFEYDNNKHCTKETRYNSKGKADKIILYEYDANGNKTRENTVNIVKHTKSEKIFEYSYY